MPSRASWLGGMSLVMFSHRNNRKHPGVHFMWWHTATQHKVASKLGELMLCKMGLPATFPIALGQYRLQGNSSTCEQAASRSHMTYFAGKHPKLSHRRQSYRVGCSEWQRERRTQHRPNSRMALLTFTWHALPSCCTCFSAVESLVG